MGEHELVYYMEIERQFKDLQTDNAALEQQNRDLIARCLAAEDTVRKFRYRICKAMDHLKAAEAL